MTRFYSLAYLPLLPSPIILLCHGSKLEDRATSPDSLVLTMTWVALRPSLQLQQVRTRQLRLHDNFPFIPFGKQVLLLTKRLALHERGS